MSKVSEALTEVLEALLVIQPAREGVLDLARLDVTLQSDDALASAKEQYDRRISLLTAVAEAARALVDDGYPALDPIEVSLDVLANLREQQSTIAAALALFKAPEQAQALSVSASDPVKK